MARKPLILVAGAAGFIGSALCRRLSAAGRPVRALVRRGGRRLPEDLAGRLAGVVEVDDLAGECPWEKIFDRVAAVVHLAGRAHTGAEDGDLFFRDNLDATVALARAARRAGVERFIFLSSIKVNGEGGIDPVRPQLFSSSDRPRPEGPYAVSKWRAEQELEKLFPPEGGTRLVILRPPLVYGPGAAGNLAGLARWLELGLPLPVPREGNRRSLVSRERLLAAIEEGLRQEEPLRLALPCDDREWSTADLALWLAAGRRVRLLPLPAALLRAGFARCRRSALYKKMYGSYLVVAGGPENGPG